MEDSNVFRKEFKYYKSRCPPPSFDQVVDFDKLEEHDLPSGLRSLEPKVYFRCDGLEARVARLMKPPTEWKIYEVNNKPGIAHPIAGLLFIQNPFTVLGQRYWIYRCLKDYTKKPHILNLDGHEDTQLTEDWWHACHREDKRSKLLKKQLRWATMGYHHNWNTKVYSETSKDPFPQDLASLCSFVTKVIGFREEFKAEAAIVNFYHFDSTLSGHTDHSEIDMTAPLFSFSFGQTAIFLLGGLLVDDKPVPLFIKSGDIVIMSGFSRQCYHGIPKILPSTDSPWDCIHNSSLEAELNQCHSVKQSTAKFSPEDSVAGSKASLQRSAVEAESLEEVPTQELDKDELSLLPGRSLLLEKFWEPFKAYIKHSRINMNVRQVLPKGSTTLNDK